MSLQNFYSSQPICWGLWSTLTIQMWIAQSAGAVEYPDCTTAEGYPPPPRLPVSCGWWLHNTWGLKTRSWWLSSLWFAPLHFGPYWTRWAVEEAWSNPSAGHVSLLLDLCKNPNEDNGCWVSHAVERLVALSVPVKVIILGMKTQGQNSCLTPAWVYWTWSPDVARWMGFLLGTSLHEALKWVGSMFNETHI